MLTRDEAQKLAQKVLGLSTMPECQVAIASSEQAYTRFANNGITTAALNLRHTVSITVAREGRAGTMTVNDLDDASLRAAVKKAEEIAAIAPINPERLPALGAQQYPKVSEFDEATANARSPQMIPHVKTVIDHALAKKQVAAGLVARTRSVTAIANKAGLFGFHESADSQLTTTFRMPDGSSSGWAGQPSTRLSQIDSAALAEAAADKCARWRTPQKIEPGNYSARTHRRGRPRTTHGRGLQRPQH
jgi:predicted Zn-dependent protease